MRAAAAQTVNAQKKEEEALFASHPPRLKSSYSLTPTAPTVLILLEHNPSQHALLKQIDDKPPLLHTKPMSTQNIQRTAEKCLAREARCFLSMFERVELADGLVGQHRVAELDDGCENGGVGGVGSARVRGEGEGFGLLLIAASTGAGAREAR